MKTVRKYQLYPRDLCEVLMPRGARVLSAASQHGILCLWALVDEREEMLVPRSVRVAGTGHSITPDEASWDFIDTVLMQGGSLVLHVFAKPEAIAAEEARNG